MFSFTDMPTKVRAECNMERCRTVKRRHLNTEQSVSVNHDEPSATEQPSPDIETDKMVVTDRHRSLAMSNRYHLVGSEQRNDEELKVMGYPIKEQSKTLKFYTGFGNFTVSMALFEFITKDLVHTRFQLSTVIC